MRQLKVTFTVILLAVFLYNTDGGETGDRWGADYFPDYKLTNQNGDQVRFFTDLVKDKIVVINFIYTSCPDTCPLETSRLREVYALLEDRMGKDIFFRSITIDPKTDTQSVLKEYADRWEVGPGWDFLTGNEAEITHLRKKLGLLSARDSVNLADHQVNMIMGNQKTGRWIHRTPFDSATVLAEHLGTWLNNYRNVKTNRNDYANAPALRSLSNGEYIFRTRCVSCHTVGGGDIRTTSTLAGPDLLNVGKKRDPKWLSRWIREPDVMINEGDPIALALLQQYNGIAMPNFRLSENDAQSVLEFIATESELHLNGHATASEKMSATKISTESEVMCPNCLKNKQAEEAELQSQKKKEPKKWIPQRLTANPANQ
ncbi:MAG: SCO family protein [Verrucomicrobiales bacterium]|nr:SCO family protein [Verrucomicrobiales bacterium]